MLPPLRLFSLRSDDLSVIADGIVLFLSIFLFVCFFPFVFFLVSSLRLSSFVRGISPVRRRAGTVMLKLLVIY